MCHHIAIAGRKQGCGGQKYADEGNLKQVMFSLISIFSGASCPVRLPVHSRVATGCRAFYSVPLKNHPRPHQTISPPVWPTIRMPSRHAYLCPLMSKASCRISTRTRRMVKYMSNLLGFPGVAINSNNRKHYHLFLTARVIKLHATFFNNSLAGM